MNIYVANLNFDLQDEDLKELFVPYGEVGSARIVMDNVTGRSRGFGFVEMADEAAGKKAIEQLNGFTVGRRPIKVNEANPKPGGTAGNRGERNFNNPNSYNQTIY
jgi:RNA recognition motif-containing protein